MADGPTDGGVIPGATDPRAGDRDHRRLAEMAAVGLEATGPDLPAVFEEVAFALAGLTADVDGSALLALDSGSLPGLEPIRLEATDLPRLVHGWLTDLLTRVGRDGALVAVEIDDVSEGPGGSSPAAGPHGGGSWALRARVASLPFDDRSVRRRPEANGRIGRLPEVARLPDGRWRIVAAVDVRS